LLDITKVQKKGSLAQEMLRLGVSNDIQQALSDIENHNLVNSNDDFKVSTTQNQEPEPEKETKIEEPPQDKSFAQRMLHIEERIRMITEFMNEYKQKNDSNLKELDENVTALRVTVDELKSAPQRDRIEPIEHNLQESISENQESVKIEETKDADSLGKIEEFKKSEKAPDEWTSQDFLVEKVFNNSNSRLTSGKGK